MLGEDFVDVFAGVGAVPGAFGVDDDDGALFAAVEAAGAVDAGGGDAQFFGAGFHVVAELFGAASSAGATFMALGALVGAAENVELVGFSHG